MLVMIYFQAERNKMNMDSISQYCSFIFDEKYLNLETVLLDKNTVKKLLCKAELQK